MRDLRANVRSQWAFTAMRYDAPSYKITDRPSGNGIMRTFDEHCNVIKEKR